MVEINDSGLPAAGEFLDMITPQYLADLMSWGAIGARTTNRRCTVSWLPASLARSASRTAPTAPSRWRSTLSTPPARHCFLSVTKWGHSAIVNTSGNGDCHIILRGGKSRTTARRVKDVKAGLSKAGLPAQVMIDFSHANSSKQFKSRWT